MIVASDQKSFICNRTLIRKNCQRIFPFLLMILWTWFLASRPFGFHGDDENYSRVFLNAKEYHDNLWDKDFLSFITSDPLFFIFNYQISKIMEPTEVHYFFCFFSIFFFNLTLFKLFNGSIVSILAITIIPIILTNLCVMLRSTMSMSWYLFFFLNTHKKTRPLRFLAPLFHSSYYLVITLEKIATFACQRLSQFKFIILANAYAICVGLCIEMIAEHISQAVHYKSTIYQKNVAPLLFFFNFVNLCLFTKYFKKENAFVYFGTAFTCWSALFASDFSTRFLLFFLPLQWYCASKEKGFFRKSQYIVQYSGIFFIIIFKFLNISSSTASYLDLHIELTQFFWKGLSSIF